VGEPGAENSVFSSKLSVADEIGFSSAKISPIMMDLKMF